MLLEYSNIFPYLGSYKALINVIKFFGYQNLRMKEYWLNIKNGKYKKADNPEFDNLDIRFPGTYIKTTGDDIVERYLDDDLEETLLVDEEFNQGTFLLASLVPTTYERVSTMGTATLWKMLMLAWSYKFKLAIPDRKSTRLNSSH